MAHNILKNDSHMNFVTPAWHSLGVTLPDDHVARYDWEEACIAAKLEWRVRMAHMDVSSDVGASGDDGRFEVTAGVAGKRVPKQYAIYREDTSEILSTVGEGYHPLQNCELFKWFTPFLQSRQCKFETAGSLFNGRIVWALAELNRDPMIVIPDSQKPDVVKKYLTLIGSHTGSWRTRALFTPTRIVCWNTLDAALRNGANEILSVRHTKNQMDALAAVRETVNVLDARFEVTKEQYMKMVAKGLSKDEIIKFIKVVLNKDEEVLGKKSQEAVDGILAAVYDGPGAEMAGETVWGAYNAITHHYTHVASKTPQLRLRSAWLGLGRDIKQRAFDLAVSLSA